jgi:predicted DNA-binding ArsR family transcriptional regulator
MDSPSPKPAKKSQNFLRKVGQKVEKTFHLSNSNVFHGSLSSLNDLPDSYYHKEIGDQKHAYDDTVSLHNLPDYNYNSSKIKLKKKYGKIK